MKEVYDPSKDRQENLAKSTEKKPESQTPKPDEKKAKEKSKKKEPKAEKGIQFPLKAKINKYAFLHFSAELLEHLGLSTPLKADIPCEITETPEGFLLLKLKKP